VRINTFSNQLIHVAKFTRCYSNRCWSDDLKESNKNPVRYPCRVRIQWVCVTRDPKLPPNKASAKRDTTLFSTWSTRSRKVIKVASMSVAQQNNEPKMIELWSHPGESRAQINWPGRQSAPLEFCVGWKTNNGNSAEARFNDLPHTPLVFDIWIYISCLACVIYFSTLIKQSFSLLSELLGLLHLILFSTKARWRQQLFRH